MFKLRLIFVLCVLLNLSVAPAQAGTCAFNNPIISPGYDPSVIYHDGYYYLVQSHGQLSITKSETITGLGRAEPVTVFTPPPGEAYSYDLWAPELVYLDGEWYIYVAGTNAPGNNQDHRTFVLKADTQDPQGSWTMMGKVYDPNADSWAIDATVFDYEDQLYIVWSGWEEPDDGFPQNLYIAEMSDPLTLSTPRQLLSEPTEPWEQTEAPIQEGPQTFIHDDQLTIVYSADASWTAAYKLGMLVLTGDDLLDPDSWVKVGPVFEQTGQVYGPGHNSSPVPSPDGSEWWLIYHANEEAPDGWDNRDIRAQPFMWDENDVPVLGSPVDVGEGLPVPAGEPCGLIEVEAEAVSVSMDDTFDPEETTFAGAYTFDGDYVDTGASLVNTLGSFSVAAWVLPDTPDATQALISQGGGISSNFVLGLTEGQFSFTLFSPDGRDSASAITEIEADAGEWYHVVGVRDVLTDELTLYVNGERVATATFPQTWAALGNTMLGTARRATQLTEMFDGAISDVQLYLGALTSDEVNALYTETSPD